MKQFLDHAKRYIFRGILAMTPIGLSIFAILFLYRVIDKRIIELLDKYIGARVPGLGILFLIVLFYFVGLAASNVFGRRIFTFLENISNRIPIVNTAYQVGKQLSLTLSLPERQVFKKAVLVDYFKPGCWSVGFITGTVEDAGTGEKLLKVFIPTVPNPTTGFFAILREKDLRDPGWSVEDALKVAISAGIIGPEKFAEPLK